ncbi:hypothetical protein AB1Y20_001717 [Prymnesium parvum]|uniref:NAD-dependent epimerase/dehydratase domain-containing protein n=1 Tax=Prymnesium parvum TaxID=97485 RepID=A0AB34KD96_PRYPA
MSLKAAVAAAAAAAAAAGALYAYRSRKRTIVITGGCGNLGVKLATHLLSAGEVNVVLLEHPDYFDESRVPRGAKVVLGDLSDGGGAWKRAIRGADSLVHFSAVNPYPNASWEECAASMSHTFNVFLAAVESRVRRVVFASSNHVMGGYKDLPEITRITPTTPPNCGTFLLNLENQKKSGNAVAYASAKLAGEQLARALACTTDRTSFVVLRIGWCQPGENLPSTLNPAGSPLQYQNKVEGLGESKATDDSIDVNWFTSMWLSNGDFVRYFSAALRARTPPREMVLVNAMSCNSGMRWSLNETEAALGVKAQDNSRK